MRNPPRLRRLTLAEVAEDGLEPEPPIGSGWGPWTLNPDTYVLDHVDRDYWIDVDRCDNSAEVLDWIAQIAKKTWADDATLAGLVRALDDIIDLQAHLCPSGHSRTITRAEIRKQVRAVAAVGQAVSRPWRQTYETEQMAIPLPDPGLLPRTEPPPMCRDQGRCTRPRGHDGYHQCVSRDGSGLNRRWWDKPTTEEVSS